MSDVPPTPVPAPVVVSKSVFDPTTFNMIYAAVLHMGAIVALVVLMALGKIDQTTGLTVLGGLVGFAVGVPVVVKTRAP